MSYFDSPAFLCHTLQMLTVLEVPLHTLGTYCILFKSPASMKTVKWSLLNLHFWSAFLDVSLGLLATPLVMFPVIAGIPLGLLTHFGFPPAVQTYLVCSLLATVAVAILHIFERRYYVLFGRTTRWRYCRVPFLLLNYTFTFVYFIPSCLHIPDQASARIIVLQILENISSEMIQEPNEIFVLTLEAENTVIPATAITLFIVGELIVFKYLLEKGLRRQVQTMKLSGRSYRLHKKFLKVIKIQILIPALILLVPLFYTASAMLFNYYNQALNNVVIIILSAHGLASTITMLLIQTDYREFVMRRRSRANKRSVPFPVVVDSQKLKA
ncbi:unnamed protein product [Caenorhabditis sp. 36 PRJEB53466]|nr:unnamed protein product [Caenorhabditis sp. 36 PRJEB53466]